MHYTLCPKNVTILIRYNSGIHESIWIIFGGNVTEKGAIKRYFSSHLSQLVLASALLGEMKTDN